MGLFTMSRCRLLASFALMVSFLAVATAQEQLVNLKFSKIGAPITIDCTNVNLSFEVVRTQETLDNQNNISWVTSRKKEKFYGGAYQFRAMGDPIKYYLVQKYTYNAKTLKYAPEAKTFITSIASFQLCQQNGMEIVRSNASPKQQVETIAQSLPKVNQSTTPDPCRTTKTQTAKTTAPAPAPITFAIDPYKLSFKFSEAKNNIANKCSINPPSPEKQIRLNVEKIDQAYEECLCKVFLKPDNPQNFKQECAGKVDTIYTKFEQAAAAKAKAAPNLLLKKNNRTFSKSLLYDYEIVYWTEYWNKVYKRNPPLSPEIVKALIASESSFDVNAKALAKKTGDELGAMGLLQIMPETRIYLSGKCAGDQKHPPKYLEHACTNPPNQDLNNNAAHISLQREDLVLSPKFNFDEWEKKPQAEKAALLKTHKLTRVSDGVQLTIDIEDAPAQLKHHIASRNICSGVRWLYRKLDLAVDKAKKGGLVLPNCAHNPCTTQEQWNRWVKIIMFYKCYVGSNDPSRCASGANVYHELYGYANQLETNSVQAPPLK